jgi:uncharacterized protein YjeT (DUF2065 family)
MGMDIVIKSIGIVIILIGIVYLLRPSVMKWLMDFFKQGSRIYFAGLVRFALAVVFLVGARECRHSWVIFAFGILCLIGGLMIFILGPEKIRRVFDWWQKQSVLFLRAMAVLAMVIGAVIIFSA